MADYRTVLTGPQIDDALTQLNNRVAEGWAVGERDGVPVSSGSPYFENNAKWYAQKSGTDSQAAIDAAATATAAAEQASELLSGVPGMFMLSRENGHLYLQNLVGFNESFNITRNDGHLHVTFN